MLDKLRMRLASVEAVPLLAVLSVVSGLLAGGVIVVFRLVVEQAQAGFLPGGVPEQYEGLGMLSRVAIPTLGGLFLGVMFQAVHDRTRRVSVVHVMERLAYYQGHMPLANAGMQFLGGALSIVSGHSVGREGPGIHLGAASASVMGQRLGLPNNSIRILVACGVAAAIAASFNTPLAGVIFAMEVVLMEYTFAGFVPVILAAVSATVLNQSVFGAEPAFAVPSLQLGSLAELPFVVVMGLVVGTVAAAFTTLWERFHGWSHPIPVWIRMTVAGLATGLLAMAVPEIMGIGYDTVSQALLGELALGALVAILAAKLLVTSFGIACGLPGGLIGPTIVIGATGGGLLGLVGDAVLPGKVASPSFYAMVGMGAMMGATLQAPLAALTAMLELTANPNIVFPGMLAIIVASLTSRYLFKKESIFLVMLRAQGLQYRHDPVAQSLRRVGVASVMDRSFVSTGRKVSRDEAERLISRKPTWILIREDHQPLVLLMGVDLARHLQSTDEASIDLMNIPASRYDVAPVSLQATLLEATEILNKQQADVLYVHSAFALRHDEIYGVLTREKIEASYR